MERIQEIDQKHEQIRKILDSYPSDSLWIRLNRNIAWFTGGSDASIPLDNEAGSYSLVITRDKRFVFASNIELVRIRVEEDFEALGFEYLPYDWYSRAPEPPFAQRISDMANGTVEDMLQQLRWVLGENERYRLRTLGKLTAEALEATAHSVKAGDSEQQIVARLGAACRERGLIMTVGLVGVDERIANFRHPVVTGKVMNQYAEIVVCARKWGLVASATRFVHQGQLSDELRDKMWRIARIDAQIMQATRPNRTLAEVFVDIQGFYKDAGEAEQWKLHHQGGITGFKSRERIATPGDRTSISEHMAFAWNPSIVGAKSEDTILLASGEFEIVTDSGKWPMLDIEIEGQLIRRPAMLEIS